MGRKPCCDKVGLKKGPWTVEEDKKLITFILTNGQCCWRALPKLAGLLRCGKSCRLRWTNYLRPDLKRGLLSEQEEKLVIDLHAQIGNRWSKIASQLPGRTDNEIKNHWNTHIKKKLKKMGIDPVTHKSLVPTPTFGKAQEEPSPQDQNPKPPFPPPFFPSDENPENSQNSKTEPSFQSFTTRTENENRNSEILSDIEGFFCTDEVPLVEPHELVLPCATSSSSCTSSSSSSVSYYSTGGNSKSNFSNILEGLELANLDWGDDLNKNMGSFWDEDNLMISTMDLLFNGDNDRDLTNGQPPNEYTMMYEF